jgi:hypothetical protein
MPQNIFFVPLVFLTSFALTCLFTIIVLNFAVHHVHLLYRGRGWVYSAALFDAERRVRVRVIFIFAGFSRVICTAYCSQCGFLHPPLVFLT